METRHASKSHEDFNFSLVIIFYHKMEMLIQKHTKGTKLDVFCEFSPIVITFKTFDPNSPQLLT